jgi:hypothetical protein
MKKGVGAGLLWLGLVLLTEEAHAQITPPPSGGGGGTPGGSNTQVQYNKTGAFGGITGATSDGTNLLVTTQAAGDASTKAASDSFVTTAVANAVAGINPAVAVQAATTTAANTSGFTYNNGVAGIGATFTGSVATAVTIDGFTFTALGQRLLVKNDTQSPSGAFNGVYYVTQLQTGLLPPVLTRALDYDQPSDINNTGAIPVVNGTVNASTSWLLTSQVTTIGTDPLTYTQFSVSPAAPITLTTTGSSGAATLSGATPPVLNIPQYTGQFQLVGTMTASGGMVATTSTGTAVVTTAGTTMTISSIPQTFNNLMLVCAGRTTASATLDYVLIALNGDAAAHYNLQQITGSGTGNASSALTNNVVPDGGLLSGNNATNSRQGCFTATIASYAQTTFQKLVSSIGGADGGASGTYAVQIALTWQSTAAVTSIVLSPASGGNFSVGSCFYLYAY